MQVSGQDSDGSSVSETLYVDEHGRGIKLLPGDYTLSIAASPIAEDGTIYTVPTTKAQVTIKSDGQDLSAQATFKLKVPSADTVTDDQIDAAAKYAEEGGASSAAAAKILQQAAITRRDAATNAEAQARLSPPAMPTLGTRRRTCISSIFRLSGMARSQPGKTAARCAFIWTATPTHRS